MEARYKKGTCLGVTADVAYAELERIRKDNAGILEAAEVVKQSKPAKAALHGEFEWDNATAAAAYQEQQAKYIIRHIEVIREECPSVQMRAYEATVVCSAKFPDKPRHVHKSVEDILRDPLARQDLLADAIRDLLSFRRRYSALSELANVIDAADLFVREAAA